MTEQDDAGVSEWLQCETISRWHELVRAPGEVFRAVGLTMDRRGLSFREALLYVVEQGSVIPVSRTTAIADLARFQALLDSLPASDK